MSIIKIGGAIAAVALTGLTLAACTSAPVEKAAPENTKVEDTVLTDDANWEAGLRVGVRHGFTADGPESTQQACEGFAMMNVTDADGVVSLLNEIAAESNQTIEEFLEVSSSDIPAGVTMDQALHVAGDEIVQICNL